MPDRFQAGSFGPACTFTGIHDISYHASNYDLVAAIVFPSWPQAAEEWPVRQRNHNWPTVETITKVVKAGCHVVRSKHPDYRDDKRQCRLSFSKAEVVLLNTWSSTQQTIYHLIRFFAKRTIIRKNCPKEDQVICTYQLKILMLRACEEHSSEWWKSTSVVLTCCRLLQKLLHCLKEKKLSNYFVVGANLLGHRLNQNILQQTIEALEIFTDSNMLSGWFAEHYIHPVFEMMCHSSQEILTAQTNPDIYYIIPSIQTMFGSSDEILTAIANEDYIHLACDLHEKQMLRRCDENVSDAHAYGMHRLTNKREVDEPYEFIGEDLISSFKDAIVEHTSWIHDYNEILVLLHTCQMIIDIATCFDNNKFLELIRLLPKRIELTRLLEFPYECRVETLVNFIEAEKLMYCLGGFSSSSEFRELFILASMEYLREYTGQQQTITGIDASYASFVYAVALFYHSRNNRAAADMCSSCLRLLLRKHYYAATFPQNTLMLQAYCLLFIDDVANVVGFRELIKHSEFGQSPNSPFVTSSKLDFKPWFFACFLLQSILSKRFEASSSNSCAEVCLMVMHNHRVSRHHQMRCSDSAVSKSRPTNTLIRTSVNQGIDREKSDMTAIKRCVYLRKDTVQLYMEQLDSFFQSKEEKMIDLLLRCSLESVAKFNKAVFDEFGIQSTALSCYKALHLYRRRRFHVVLSLCEKILREPELEPHLEQYFFLNVHLVTPYDVYFDDDIRALIGFNALFYATYPLAFKDIDLKTFISKFRDTNTAVFVLCHLKQHEGRFPTWGINLSKFKDVRPQSVRFLGSRFVATYLKMRCFMDCNRPFPEIYSVFRELKCRHYFEHIITAFLRQRLRRLYDAISV